MICAPLQIDAEVLFSSDPFGGLGPSEGSGAREAVSRFAFVKPHAKADVELQASSETTTVTLSHVLPQLGCAPPPPPSPLHAAAAVLPTVAGVLLYCVGKRLMLLSLRLLQLHHSDGAVRWWCGGCAAAGAAAVAAGAWWRRAARGCHPPCAPAAAPASECASCRTARCCRHPYPRPTASPQSQRCAVLRPFQPIPGALLQEPCLETEAITKVRCLRTGPFLIHFWR